MTNNNTSTIERNAVAVPDESTASLGHHGDSYDEAGRLKDTPANRALHPMVPDGASFEKVRQLDCSMIPQFA